MKNIFMKQLIILGAFLLTLGYFSLTTTTKAYFTDDNFAKHRKIASESLEVTYDETSYTFSYPFEQVISRIIKIKNTKKEPISVDLKANININGRDEELQAWPQPRPEIFNPQEEKEIIFRFEFSSDLINNTQTGKKYEYPFVININRKDKPESLIHFSIDNKVLILKKDQDQNKLPSNAKISGNVIDINTGQPISDARVRVFNDLPISSHDGQTDSLGNFTIAVPAYQRKILQNWVEYNVSIEKNGYENYNVAIAPKENDDLKLEAKMRTSTESADYKLISKYDTELPATKVDFSTDGLFFATVPFHSSEKIDFIKQKAYLHLFSTDGKLVCRYKLDNELPTVSISADSKIIATVYRRSTENWDGGDDVVLLDDKCQETWRFTEAKKNGSGPSEVKISHSGEFLGIGTFDGRAILLDIKNRKMVWSNETSNGQIRQILFNEDDSGIYFGSDPNLFFYKINGDLGWRANIGAWPYSMAESDKYIFAGVKAGRFLSLINKISGDIIWRYPIAARPDNMLISPDETYFIYQSSNGGLAIKNAVFDVTGKLLFNLRGANAGMITPDSEYFAYYNSNSISLVNRRGNELWRQELDREKWSAPRGGVYISPDKKKIIVADAVNGNVYFFEGSLNNISGHNNSNNRSIPMDRKTRNITIIASIIIAAIATGIYLFRKIGRKNKH